MRTTFQTALPETKRVHLQVEEEQEKTQKTPSIEQSVHHLLSGDVLQMPREEGDQGGTRGRQKMVLHVLSTEGEVHTTGGSREMYMREKQKEIEMSLINHTRDGRVSLDGRDARRGN